MLSNILPKRTVKDEQNVEQVRFVAASTAKALQLLPHGKETERARVPLQQAFNENAMQLEELQKAKDKILASIRDNSKTPGFAKVDPPSFKVKGIQPGTQIYEAAQCAINAALETDRAKIEKARMNSVISGIDAAMEAVHADCDELARQQFKYAVAISKDLSLSVYAAGEQIHKDIKCCSYNLTKIEQTFADKTETIIEEGTANDRPQQRPSSPGKWKDDVAQLKAMLNEGNQAIRGLDSLQHTEDTADALKRAKKVMVTLSEQGHLKTFDSWTNDILSAIEVEIEEKTSNAGVAALEIWLRKDADIHQIAPALGRTWAIEMVRKGQAFVLAQRQADALQDVTEQQKKMHKQEAANSLAVAIDPTANTLTKVIQNHVKAAIANGNPGAGKRKTPMPPGGEPAAKRYTNGEDGNLTVTAFFTKDCKFFARGECRNGAKCTFKHDQTCSNCHQDICTCPAKQSELSRPGNGKPTRQKNRQGGQVTWW